MENHPEVRIKRFGAHGIRLIAGGWCAITREACCSHGFNAFLVEKGNEEARVSRKYVYIECNSYYLG